MSSYAARRVLAKSHARRTRKAGSARPLLGGCLLVAGLVLLTLAAAVLLTGVAALGWYNQATQNLPDANALPTYEFPATTRIWDRTHTHLLAMIYTEDRDPVVFADLPENLVNATVATEDKTFWTNSGVDSTAIVRAVVNHLSGKGGGGASTITQQLVKRLLVGNEQTLTRKVREATLAMRVTQTLSKEQILSLYLDSLYYGEGAYGPSAAARRFFGKTLSELTLGEAALLAGLPQSPSALDPFVNPEAAQARRQIVLDAMVRNGYATPYSAAIAADESLTLVHFAVPQPPVVWFSDRAIEEAAVLVGSLDTLKSCGCDVTTTLDWDMQVLAQKAVTDFIKSLPASDHASNAALVAEDPATGEVLAYVGSIDQNDNSPLVVGGYDSAGLALRSPGSSWKGIGYLGALEAGHLSATSRLWDVSTELAPDYRPHNGNPSRPWNGPVTIRQAIRESRNIPAMRAVLAYGGTAAMADMAKRLGITTDFDPTALGPAAAIGANGVLLTDMTAAYSSINAEGLRVQQHKIMRITSPTGVDITVAPTPTQVVDPRLAWTMLDILRDNTDPQVSVTGGSAALGRPAGIKTGTGVGIRDTYTVGFIPQLTAGVWMGNADYSPMAPTIHSYSGPQIIWRDFMRAVIKLPQYQEALDWQRPDGMVQEAVCASRTILTGWGVDQAPGLGCPFGSAQEWFIPGFNDPATKLATNGPAFGEFRVDPATNRVVPVDCVHGLKTLGVLAKAELPAWQNDLETWVQQAKTGQWNQGGRFHWESINWILPPLPSAGCPAAQPPLAADDSYQTDLDSVLAVTAPGVLTNDSDPEGGQLSAEQVTGARHGQVNLSSDGSFTYTPDPGYNGPDNFTYLVRVDGATSTSATVALQVGPLPTPEPTPTPTPIVLPTPVPTPTPAP